MQHCYKTTSCDHLPGATRRTAQLFSDQQQIAELSAAGSSRGAVAGTFVPVAVLLSVVVDVILLSHALSP
jgi:hypothetical protein